MIDSRFLINLKGKEFVLYAGLLDAATKSGLVSLTVRLLQVPAAENGHLAICEATARFEDGRQFVEIGDAGPQNLSPQMAPAACRMSATRAKARVLRDALNVGVCSFEELPPQGQEEPAVESTAAESAAGANGHVATCERCTAILSASQAKLSAHRLGRYLCPTHQRSAHQ